MEEHANSTLPPGRFQPRTFLLWGDSANSQISLSFLVTVLHNWYISNYNSSSCCKLCKFKISEVAVFFLYSVNFLKFPHAYTIITIVWPNSKPSMISGTNTISADVLCSAGWSLEKGGANTIQAISYTSLPLPLRNTIGRNQSWRRASHNFCSGPFK